jgi:hypothetical protein
VVAVAIPHPADAYDRGLEGSGSEVREISLEEIRERLRRADCDLQVIEGLVEGFGHRNLGVKLLGGVVEGELGPVVGEAPNSAVVARKLAVTRSGRRSTASSQVPNWSFWPDSCTTS